MSLTDRPPRKCNVNGCPNIGDWVPYGGRCPEHARAQGKERKANRNLGAPWQRQREYLRGCGNTTCQRVRNGVRCKEPVYYFHHIIEVASRPDLELHQENIVGVCRSCHPRPDDRDQGEYVPTLWRVPMSGDPIPETLVQPGQEVPRGVVLWNLANRLTRFAQ